jgi:membrane dipeptidase
VSRISPVSFGAAQYSGGQYTQKAKQGGVDVVVENIWAEPAYQPYNVTTKQVIRLLETFYQVLEQHRDRMELAVSMADVKRIAATKKMAVILGLEAGWDMDGDLHVLRFTIC